MLSLEQDPRLTAYYNTTQILTVELSSGTNTERLKDVKVCLQEPVSLDGMYAWAFTKSNLSETEQKIITTDKDGKVTESTIYANSYSVGYSKNSITIDGISIQAVSPIRAELKGTSIFAKADNAKLEFYNTVLKSISGCTNELVNIVFSVYLSDGSSYLYTIDRGCMFTIL